ncbi:UDENN domain-containing protein [Plasmodiophora brassicae]|nr:hypothetical protein PBRA_008772 [Plasmodiophora brassicae]
MSLFTHFLVVRLVSDGGDVSPRVYMAFCAPGHSVGTLPPGLLAFSFPDLGEFRYSSRLVSEAFSVVMSNATMFCRRHLQPATKKPSSASKSPLECLCLVTSRDDVGEILSSALQHVQIRWLLEPNAVPPLLLSLLKQEAPKPSGHIALAMSGNGVEEKFMFHRPAFDHMSVPCNVLYEYLSVDNCIAVMSAMLLEQRVIMCSSSLTALSSCVNAARSLLFPFKWKHSFYPVLPNSLLHHTLSPFPFLIGVIAGDLEKLLQLPLSPALVVRLDDNFLVQFRGTVNMLPLPTGAGAKLRTQLGQIAPQGVLSDTLKKGLNTILGKAVDAEQCLVSDAIYASWMAFYVALFHNWRRFLVRSDSGQPRIDVAKLLDDARNASEDDFVFFQALTRTDLFKAFAQELVAHTQSDLTSDPNDFSRLCTKVVRKDAASDPASIYSSTIDSIKTEMYPNRAGRFAGVALDVTSSTPTTPDTRQAILSLTQATYSSMGLREILGVVNHRLYDSAGRSWRHATLSFNLLRHLITHGSDAVLCQMRDLISQIVPFTQYAHKEEEVQTSIRNQAEAIIHQLLDMPSQVQGRRSKYVIAQDGLSGYRVAHSSDKAKATKDPVSAAVQQQMETVHVPLRASYSAEFPSDHVRRLIEGSLDSWRKYQSKSLRKDRARIVPKFTKLHKKMRPDVELSAASSVPRDGSRARTRPADGVFEDLLQLGTTSARAVAPPAPPQSAGETNVVVMAQTARTPSNATFDPFLMWTPSAQTPPVSLRQMSSPSDDDPLLDFSNLSFSSASTRSAPTSVNLQKQAALPEQFDPFASLFKSK